MKYLVCNQKMYLTKDEAYQLKMQLDLLKINNNDKFILCPSYINFDVFNEYNICSQNVFYENKGAYTGEISAYMLSLINVKYSLIAHSERRHLETSKTINLKIKSCFENSIVPILCIGETKYEKEMRKTSFILKKQLKEAFENISQDKYNDVFIAYEPRYLIGTTKTLEKGEIIDIVKYIKKVLKEININNYKILYGGAVNESNIKNIDTDEIDGYLIGSASISANEIKEIIKCIK